jgi:hypothetical protein
MKHVITIFILASLSVAGIAQDEIYFNNLDVDKKEIKVASQIRGIEFGNDFATLFPTRYYGYLSGSVETHLGIFHENRIGNIFTFNKYLGLNNAMYHIKVFDGSAEDNYVSYTDRKTYAYELSAELRLEPRWYFGLRSRYRHNQSVANNAGWFLSLPFTFTGDILYQPVYKNDDRWLADKLWLKLVSPPTLGYRSPLGKRLFLEASAGYIPIRLWYFDGEFLWRTASKIGAFSSDSFNFNIKVAYTF